MVGWASDTVKVPPVRVGPVGVAVGGTDVAVGAAVDGADVAVGTAAGAAGSSALLHAATKATVKPATNASKTDLPGFQLITTLP